MQGLIIGWFAIESYLSSFCRFMRRQYNQDSGPILFAESWFVLHGVSYMHRFIHKARTSLVIS